MQLRFHTMLTVTHHAESDQSLFSASALFGCDGK